MQRIIVFDDGDMIANATQCVNEPEEEIEISENADAYEEVIRRQDDIDQLTGDYLCALIGIDGETFDLADIGIDKDSLYAIEDAIEEVLNEFGINIYRPTIIADSDGNEVFVNSIFDINQ